MIRTENKVDTWREGFESGVSYTFGHIPVGTFTNDELFRFASFMELKLPWKTDSEWYELIRSSHVTMTKEKYEDRKNDLKLAKERQVDNPVMSRILESSAKSLDEYWKRIVDSGLER